MPNPNPNPNPKPNQEEAEKQYFGGENAKDVMRELYDQVREI